MYCRNCGKELPDYAKFCADCGTPVEQPAPEPLVIPEPVAAEPEPAPENEAPRREQPENVPNAAPVAAQEPELPAENRPLSPWAYFGYGLLFSIPVIGLILLIVFSFVGGNVNRRNFARSYWCKYLIVLAIILIVAVLIITNILRSALEFSLIWLRDTGFPWLAGLLGS